MSEAVKIVEQLRQVQEGRGPSERRDMTMTESSRMNDASAALAARGRSPEISESDDLYGWLIGSWTMEVRRYRAIDVSARGLKGEIHFGWALEGRAVQDVWIMPERSARTGEIDRDFNMYGTTIRAWDPVVRAWRITWINPAHGHYEQQIGRRSGTDIVQIGARADGTPTRWTFTEITKDSFHWLGEALGPDGRTWVLEGEFLAKRVP